MVSFLFSDAPVVVKFYLFVHEEKFEIRAMEMEFIRIGSESVVLV